MANEIRLKAGVKDDATRPLKGIKDAIQSVQKEGAKGFAIGAGAAITAAGFTLLDSAISGTIGAVSGAIQAGSDLNESMAKSGTIFGDNAGAIDKWAETASTSMQMSKRAALDTVSGFAGLFKTVGIEIDEATEKSKGLSQLGADLASFFNTDVATAVQALKSGLSGESEPLRQFNVFLSETAVNSKLAQMGIQKVGGQFTEAQKITARYALIMEQTGDAQGDVARTGDGLAGSQKSLAAKVEDLSAKFGQVLIPAMDAVVDGAAAGADAMLGFAVGIDEALKKATGSADPLGDLGTGLEYVAHAITHGGNTSGYFIGKLEEMDEAAKAAAAAEVDLRESNVILGKTMDELREDVRGVTPAVASLTQKLEGLEEASETAFDTVLEALFGEGELKNREQGLKMDLQDAIRELRRLEAIRNPTRAQRRDIIETREKVDGYRRELIETRIKLAALGNKPAGETVMAWLLKLAQRNDAVGDAAREAYFWQYKLAHAPSAGQGGIANPMPRAQGHAHGGIIPAGEWAVVGEKQAELIGPAGHAREVIPGIPGQESAGPVVVVNLTYSPTFSTASVAEAEAFARAILPELAREMRRQSLLH